MIKATSLKLSFGGQNVFDDISFYLNENDRIGLVGRNGSGKTTLLKAIINPAELDAGLINVVKNKKIAYMPQEVVLDSTLNIFDETFSTFAKLCKLIQRVTELDILLEQTSTASLLEEYGLIQEQLAQYPIEDLKAKTTKILLGLGFLQEQLAQPVSTLSVGWKMRIILAKLLLLEADFYLFDEPTNHLDLIAKEWFLQFLQQAKFGFLLICHEKYFLDELCDKILELERGKATLYVGNYSEFLEQKEHNLTLLEAAFVQQQKVLKQQQTIIDRFKASASKAKMAQSMAKKLEKTVKIVLPPSTKDVRFKFSAVPASGRIVLNVTNVSQTFANKTIFKNVSFEVQAKRKVAIIAPNGGGKTTLFNLMTGALPLQNGNITFGFNVSFAIFAQDQNKALNQDQTILENIKRLCPMANEQTIRSFLGSFLFSGDDVSKKVSVLSGGEKNRVGMVSTLLQNANLLLLDEPTNHLDIPSKEILLKALSEYQGTLIFVSHDRDFVNSLATDIIELSKNGIHWFEGNYDEYIYQKQCFEKDTKIIPSSNDTTNTVAQKEERPSNKNNPKRADKNIIQNKQPEVEIEILKTKLKSLVYGSKEFEDTLKRVKALKTAK